MTRALSILSGIREGTAGNARSADPTSVEYLEGRLRLRPLEPFQEEVKTELSHTLREAGKRAIVTLPTGAGKTRVAVESLRDWLTGRYDAGAKAIDRSIVLWLAHTEELYEQACTCFKQVWEGSENVCPLLLVRFWGHYTQDLAKHRQPLEQILTQPGVLVSTPQRIINLLDRRIEGGEAVLDDLTGALGFVVIDEAHRAAAPSCQRIMDVLIPKERATSVVGLTATPTRRHSVTNRFDGSGSGRLQGRRRTACADRGKNPQAVRLITLDHPTKTSDRLSAPDRRAALRHPQERPNGTENLLGGHPQFGFGRGDGPSLR